MKILRNLLAATVVLSACDSGSPPTMCSTPPAQTLFTGAQVTVPVCFSDADGDLLVYQATSSDQDVIHVNANQNVLTLTANMPGQSTITVVASDPGGLSGELTFPVTVPNRDPEVVAEIGDQHIQHLDHVHLDRQGRPHLLAGRRQGGRRLRELLRRHMG